MTLDQSSSDPEKEDNFLKRASVGERVCLAGVGGSTSLCIDLSMGYTDERSGSDGSVFAEPPRRNGSRKGVLELDC